MPLRLRALLLKHTDDFIAAGAEAEFRALLKKLEKEDPNRLVRLAKERVRRERRRKREHPGEDTAGYAQLCGGSKSYVVVYPRAQVYIEGHHRDSAVPEDQKKFEERPTCKGCITWLKDRGLFKPRKRGRPPGTHVPRTAADNVCHRCDAVHSGARDDGGDVGGVGSFVAL